MLAKVIHMIGSIFDDGPDEGSGDTIVLRGGTHCNKPIEVTALRPGAKMLAGTRPLELAWTGGCAPFTVSVLRSNGLSLHLGRQSHRAFHEAGGGDIPRRGLPGHGYGRARAHPRVASPGRRRRSSAPGRLAARALEARRHCADSLVGRLRARGLARSRRSGSCDRYERPAIRSRGARPGDLDQGRTAEPARTARGWAVEAVIPARRRPISDHARRRHEDERCPIERVRAHVLARRGWIVAQRARGRLKAPRE